MRRRVRTIRSDNGPRRTSKSTASKSKPIGSIHSPNTGSTARKPPMIKTNAKGRRTIHQPRERIAVRGRCIAGIMRSIESNCRSKRRVARARLFGSLDITRFHISLWSLQFNRCEISVEIGRRPLLHPVRRGVRQPDRPKAGLPQARFESRSRLVLRTTKNPQLPTRQLQDNDQV